MPMEPDEATHKLWEQLQSTGQKIGLAMKAISTGGCSDGNYTSAAGTPTIDGMGIVGTNNLSKFIAHKPYGL